MVTTRARDEHLIALLIAVDWKGPEVEHLKTSVTFNGKELALL